jgi:hypothetical protein
LWQVFERILFEDLSNNPLDHPVFDDELDLFTQDRRSASLMRRGVAISGPSARRTMIFQVEMGMSALIRFAKW